MHPLNCLNSAHLVLLFSGIYADISDVVDFR